MFIFSSLSDFYNGISLKWTLNATSAQGREHYQEGEIRNEPSCCPSISFCPCHFPLKNAILLFGFLLSKRLYHFNDDVTVPNFHVIFPTSLDRVTTQPQWVPPRHGAELRQ